MDRNYKHCKNKDTDCCILWSACGNCYYHEEDLICPNCGRIIANNTLFRKFGCTACVPKKDTKYCNGRY